ncbi:Fc receptor-like A isoform X5 [Erinaceus europaeus]|uniref:Fc receptor-like A isoform X5 n=1 Tax=Erinaceus europaeus TaxID=9365 RepID=A0ABM3XZ42_ERIEU|nr:Fc receptor-like A isoform X5 [Erinaceus europaeus]
MKLGCVPQAVGFYLSFTVLWAAQMLLAASVNMLQCGHPVSTQDSRCAPQKDDLKNPEEADFQIKGYTFSEPFHLIVSYDPSSTIAPLSMNPTPQKMAAPETAHTDSQDPPPSATSSEDSGSSSSQFRSDPFLHHQMGVLLKQVQDVKTLLGYLVMELRDLSSHQKPRTTKDPSKKK